MHNRVKTRKKRPRLTSVQKIRRLVLLQRETWERGSWGGRGEAVGEIEKKRFVIVFRTPNQHIWRIPHISRPQVDISRTADFTLG